MPIAIVKPDVPSEFLVDNRVYTDPKLFDAERERLFLRVWNFVCHESEVREPGDFLTTTVAGQPIVVCRTKAGEGPRVLPARCPAPLPRKVVREKIQYNGNGFRRSRASITCGRTIWTAT